MPHGTGTRLAAAGSLLGSCSSTSAKSLSNSDTGQPLCGRAPFGTSATASRPGSAGTSNGTGVTPSRSGPATQPPGQHLDAQALAGFDADLEELAGLRIDAAAGDGGYRQWYGR